MSHFRKILIANRGEIAVRVARTCRALGIPTVAVFSEADRDALHVREADEALFLGPSEATASYLNIEALLLAAGRAGADAVHPGYGFLSQNPDFAEALEASGVAFIGPPGAVHRAMGDKAGARRLMASAGVPVVPGYEGDDQSDARLAAEAARIAFPVMIKPSRGGGGKGMRVVRAPGELPAALAACRREAGAAFGADALVLERFLEKPRHVEVQILGDGHGTLLHLFERECSIQRRHQKVAEETPSPGLSPDTRAALLSAGLAAARAVSYVNAGTVEFLLDASGAFHFLEMNTRLQVEHPVTEALTGLDLVRLQIAIAAGGRLGLSQGEIVPRGHALECRVYAEDPGDLPSPGTILHWCPPEGPGIRVDSGVAVGSPVPIHYDPLLAKIVSWGWDRAESLERMSAALSRTAVLGVHTNLSRLRALVDHPAFRRGELHTGFIAEHLGSPGPRPPSAPAVAAAWTALQGTPSPGPGTPRDPWDALGPWRLP